MPVRSIVSLDSVAAQTISGRQETRTGSAGRYQFTEVAPGAYIVMAETKPGYWPTTPISATVIIGANTVVTADPFSFYWPAFHSYLSIIVQ